MSQILDVIHSDVVLQKQMHYIIIIVLESLENKAFVG